jgi:hypothetical protein
MANRARDRVKSVIFHLRVTLLRVEPAVWRVIRAPGDIHLGHFHLLLRERYVKHSFQESRGGIPKASHLAS